MGAKLDGEPRFEFLSSYEEKSGYDWSIVLAFIYVPNVRF